MQKSLVKKVSLDSIGLSVVVTVYKETFSITETVERILAKNRGYILEIILLTASKAPLETLSVCESVCGKYPKIVRQVRQKENPGVGLAIREGYQVALGNYIGIMSADLETEPEAVDRMVQKIEATGCDGVVANRWMRGGGFFKYSPVKLVLNWGFQQIFKVLYWTKISDLSYGFKIMKAEVIKRIKWEGIFHEIFIETTIKPIKLGYRLEQVPSIWVGRSEGESVNVFLKNFIYVKWALKVLFSKKKELKV
ncbi:MAG: glycosyltransferase [Candidatus Gribaldobacteria bacterium]|nr:glycosyltransferase [Candidatus Gribaldobacteria bacterium]